MSRELASVSIVATPDTCSGAARFDGHRLPVSLILQVLEAQPIPGIVMESYPSLPDGWFELLEALSPVLRKRYRRAIKEARQMEPQP